MTSGAFPNRSKHLRTGWSRDGDFARSTPHHRICAHFDRGAAASAWGRTFVWRTSHVEIARREYEHEYDAFVRLGSSPRSRYAQQPRLVFAFSGALPELGRAAATGEPIDPA